MINKIQTISFVRAIGIGRLGLNICRRNFSRLIWGIRSNIFLKRKKKIYIVKDSQRWDEISNIFYRDISSINAVGFDCEWVHTRDGRHPVALMQLATYSGNCALIRLNYLNQNIPLSLKEILENVNIVKVGVEPNLDARYLFEDYNIKINCWLDLRHLAMEAQSKSENDDSSSGKGLSLKALAKRYLGKELDKKKGVIASDWERPKLSYRQINYAAEDASVGIQILLFHLKMVWKPDSSWPPFRLKSWESETAKGIRTICSPFLELMFKQKRRELG